jgi:hypothetical protein
MLRLVLVLVLLVHTIPGLTQVMSNSFGLPVIYASGGAGKSKVWVKPTAKVLEESPGWIWDVCSNLLGEKIRVSGSLAPQGVNKYNVDNLSDDNPTTAWVEGKPDYGIGEFIEVIGPRIYNLIIYNGYQKSPSSFRDNSRVQSLMLSENGVNKCIIRLKDEMGAQYISLEKLKLDRGENSRLKFTILEIYPGAKYKDVAISEMYMRACCVSGDALLYLSDNQTIKMQDAKGVQNILLLDAEGKAVTASLKGVSSVIHRNMLSVTVEDGSSITLTLGHKVYSGNLDQWRYAGQLNPGDMLFKYKNGKIEKVRIVSISELSGEVETFYFDRVDNIDPNAKKPFRAILNGFVVSDEFLEKLNNLNSKAMLH